MKGKYPFLDSSQEQKIINAIREAEYNTSGEIRVHIQENSKRGVSDLKAAKKIFIKLGMAKTSLRNAILFHVATDRKSISIIGDKGINKVVSDDFWEILKEKIISHFKNQDYVRGIVEGILMAGEALKKHFPYQKDHINELSNEISKS